MTSVSARSVLSTDGVHRLVEQWRSALTRRASPAELLPLLANGLLLELPGHTVRGVREFQTWYQEAGAAGLAAGGGSADEVEVRLVSPIHAQVTITPATGEAAGVPVRPERDTGRQTWWVVLQNGEPRIRGIAVQQPALSGALAGV
ncbi:hypothetical protein ACIGXM_10325 [Kitasatospora sp. NPDC052896]|uniref:hypothetical protein n=1 Tax=Kitasatospora sp. NPDC052896 TaxID=3364061 RepID=UPI0037CC66C0